MFNIFSNGAVVVGNNFTIDGHWDRPFRVVTHFHSDHILELDKSVRDCAGIIATPVTIDILNILGYKIPKFKDMRINYNLPIKIEDEIIELKPSEHVIGSAQVMVRLKDGTTIAYTGDFKNPGKGTPILNPNILIIEATYGKPGLRRPFKDEVEMLLGDYIKDYLIKGPVRVYGYHGKLQEVMIKLREQGIDAPFIVSGKIDEITRLAIKYGFKIHDIYNTSSPEASEIIKSNWYISFHHYLEFRRRSPSKATDFLISGWEFRQPVRRLDERSYIIALSDHADFDELIYYIDNSDADVIVTDGGRKSYAKELANYVTRNLGKRAISMPMENLQKQDI